MAIEKPWGITLDPRRTLSREEAELDSEIAELQAIEVKRIRAENKARDPIGELIGAKICKRNESFWFITFNGLPVSVTHFYPEKNTAIDVFQVIGVQERREIEFKRRAFREEGLKYAALDYSMEVSELTSQLKNRSLWPLSRT